MKTEKSLYQIISELDTHVDNLKKYGEELYTAHTQENKDALRKKVTETIQNILDLKTFDAGKRPEIEALCNDIVSLGTSLADGKERHEDIPIFRECEIKMKRNRIHRILTELTPATL